MAKKERDVTPVLGRPTDYRPEYCEMLIRHMEQGNSFETFAAIVGSTKKTVYNWKNQFPDFLHAFEQGAVLSELWWERQTKNGLFSMNGISMNPTIYRLNMINRFNWKDKAEEKKVIEIDFAGMTNDDIDKEIAQLEGENGSTGKIKDKAGRS